MCPPHLWDEKQKSLGQRKPGSRGLGWAANQGEKTPPYFLLCLYTTTPPSLPRLADGPGQSWLTVCGTRRWRQKGDLTLSPTHSPGAPVLTPWKKKFVILLGMNG